MQLFKLDVFIFLFFLIIFSSIFCFFNLNKNRYLLNVWNRFIISIFIILFLLFLIFLDSNSIFCVDFVFENYYIYLKIFFLFCCLFSLIIFPIYNNYINWEYTLILLVLFFGIFSVVYSNNLFVIFLGFELIAVCIYILIFLGQFSKKLVESGISYFILSALVNLILLLGISCLFVYYPSLYFVDIQLILNSDLYLDYPLFFIFFLIFISFAFKIGIAPFYNWLPVIYEGFSINLLILLMVPVKIAYFIVLLKLLQGPFLSILFFLCPLFFCLGLLSTFVGFLGALRATSFKVLFVFASILHSGLLFIFLAFFTEDSLKFLFIYLLFYGFLILVIFSFCCFVNQRLGFINISEFSSLIINNRNLSWWFFLNLFSFIGIPPLMGFFLKSPFVMLFIDNSSIFYIMVFLILLSSGGFYYLKILRKQKFNEMFVCIRLVYSSTVFNSWFVVILSFIQVFLFFFSSFLFLLFSSYYI